MKHFVTKYKQSNYTCTALWLAHQMGTSGCGYLDMVDLFIFSNKRHILIVHTVYDYYDQTVAVRVAGYFVGWCFRCCNIRWWIKS